MGCPFDPLAALKARLNSFEDIYTVAVHQTAVHHGLHHAVNYAALGNGKRLRPYLILAIGDCLGVPEVQLLPAAIAVEMLHGYSLVHDDLPAMDDDDLRRGRLTVHRAFDEATAILVGDALLIESFAVLAGAEAISAQHRLGLLQMLAEKSGGKGMVAGQMLDMEAEGKSDLHAVEMLEIQLLKTGAIFEYCAVAPAILADSAKLTKQALSQFGQYLGELFQLSDDIIGATVDTEVSGKPKDSDAKNHKANLVCTQGIEAVRKQCLVLVEQSQSCLHAAGIDSAELDSLLKWIAVRDR